MYLTGSCIFVLSFCILGVSYAAVAGRKNNDEEQLQELSNEAEGSANGASDLSNCDVGKDGGLGDPESCKDSQTKESYEDYSGAYDGPQLQSPNDVIYNWRYGVVPYIVNPTSYDQLIADRIRRAMDVIEKDSCVLFKEAKITDVYKLQHSIVQFHNPDKIRECMHSIVLGEGGFPVLILGYDCMQEKDIIHLLMHLLGFKDEVTHPNRDSHVRVLWENIQPKYRPLFAISRNVVDRNFGEYDMMSIMHFHARAYSLNGGATIVPLVPGQLINPSDKLSVLDKMKLRLAYGHECNRRGVVKLMQTCRKNVQGEAVDANGQGSSGEKCLENFYTNRGNNDGDVASYSEVGNASYVSGSDNGGSCSGSGKDQGAYSSGSDKGGSCSGSGKDQGAYSSGSDKGGSCIGSGKDQGAYNSGSDKGGSCSGSNNDQGGPPGGNPSNNDRDVSSYSEVGNASYVSGSDNGGSCSGSGKDQGAYNSGSDKGGSCSGSGKDQGAYSSGSDKGGSCSGSNNDQGGPPGGNPSNNDRDVSSYSEVCNASYVSGSDNGGSCSGSGKDQGAYNSGSDKGGSCSGSNNDGGPPGGNPSNNDRDVSSYSEVGKASYVSGSDNGGSCSGSDKGNGVNNNDQNMVRSYIAKGKDKSGSFSRSFKNIGRDNKRFIGMKRLKKNVNKKHLRNS